MYGKKYMGIVRSTFLVDENGTIIKSWENVKVPGHVENVLENCFQSITKIFISLKQKVTKRQDEEQGKTS